MPSNISYFCIHLITFILLFFLGGSNIFSHCTSFNPNQNGQEQKEPQNFKTLIAHKGL